MPLFHLRGVRRILRDAVLDRADAEPDAEPYPASPLSEDQISWSLLSGVSAAPPPLLPSFLSLPFPCPPSAFSRNGLFKVGEMLSIAKLSVIYSCSVFLLCGVEHSDDPSRELFNMLLPSRNVNNWIAFESLNTTKV